MTSEFFYRMVIMYIGYILIVLLQWPLKKKKVPRLFKFFEQSIAIV